MILLQAAGVFHDKIDFNLSVLSYMHTDLYVSRCHLNRQFMHSFSGYITKKFDIQKCVIFL